jgi:hypothetical protein
MTVAAVVIEMAVVDTETAVIAVNIMAIVIEYN